MKHLIALGKIISRKQQATLFGGVEGGGSTCGMICNDGTALSVRCAAGSRCIPQSNAIFCCPPPSLSGIPPIIPFQDCNVHYCPSSSS